MIFFKNLVWLFKNNLEDLKQEHSNTTHDGLKGFSRDVIIDTQKGTTLVKVDNPQQKKFNVFTKIEDSYMVFDKLEDESLDSFRISLYDESTFENERLDCSKKPIKVNYVVIFE
jgi:hypothetical protein